MDVCFIKTGKAYLPEIYAYSDYLSCKGLSTVIVESEAEAKKINASLYYRVGGLLTNKIMKNKPEIHEYHTVSIGRFSMMKNLMKSVLCVKPDYLSFLTPFVESKYSFSRHIPRFYRDMGATSQLLKQRELQQDKQFDICYFGSLSTRNKLVDTLLSLAEQGFSLVVGGVATRSDKLRLQQNERITFLGECEREKVYYYLSQSRFGLNYMPNEYPLTQQTSTKVIEYLVAGLPILSNTYPWITQHSQQLGYSYIELPQSNSISLPKNSFQPKYRISLNSARALTWDAILEHCQFEKIIRQCIGK